MAASLSFCQFGAGRIGKVHAANLARHPRADLRYVVDVVPEAAAALAAEHGAEVAEAEAALADPEVGAALIASATDTHADLIERAARAGKAVFCEKPIDLDMARVERCLAVVEECATPLFVGFNRRFDPDFARLHAALRGGAVGELEMVTITSRDPEPPPLDYIAVSGGLFRDMMIHDFDMARWLLGEEPVEVFAAASCLVDPAIGAAGDVDSAAVTLKTGSGRLCQISNSRRAAYGYDQRIEVLGQGGMLQADNRTDTAVRWFTDSVVASDPPLYFFLERYAAAYAAELDAFVVAVEFGTPPSPSGEDGRQALRLADAALESYRAGRPVAL